MYVPDEVWEQIIKFLDQERIIESQEGLIITMIKQAQDLNSLINSQQLWIQNVERQNRILARRLGFLRQRYNILRHPDYLPSQRALHLDTSDEESDSDETIVEIENIDV